MKAAVLGAGVIGAGWAARFLLHGWDVAVWDTDSRAMERVKAVQTRAADALSKLYDIALPRPGNLNHYKDVTAAVADCDWIQESVPEQLEIKQALYAGIAGAVRENVPVASSTSGFKPTELASGSPLAHQILVCHPFNPVYLIPGVEVVPGEKTAAEIAALAPQILRSIGMQAVVIDAEIDAHVADRLLEAVWREALWLVNDGVATTSQIDEIIRTTFGLRWAQMGLFETYRLAGGEGGFRHFLQQFGPALQWPWTKLMDVPELTDELVDRIVAQSDEQSMGRNLAQMEDQRDRNLVALLRALKDEGQGAGLGISRFEAGDYRP